jgi:hypothetical protein
VFNIEQVGVSIEYTLGKPMRKNTALLREQEADRMRHVRAEIGRRLREQYGAPSMPHRLADLFKKLEGQPPEPCDGDATCPRKSIVKCKCDSTMKLVTRISPLGAQSGLRVYECPACSAVAWRDEQPSRAPSS